MAQKLYDILNHLQYCKSNPQNLFKVLMIDDPLNRSSIAALYRGTAHAKKPVIMLSHFDVVAVAGFGSLKEFALNPEE